VPSLPDERLKGEAGESPALTRNCEKRIACFKPGRPPKRCYHNLADRRWKYGLAVVIEVEFLPVACDREFCFCKDDHKEKIDTFTQDIDSNPCCAVQPQSFRIRVEWIAMKRTLFFTSILVCLTLLLGACGTVTPTPTTTPTTPTITLTDGLNRTVTLAGPAERVVSLAPSNTEILYAIGADTQVVGRDEFSDYPEEAKSLPSVGGSMSNYDLEAIAALHPDLVLAAQINTQDQVKAIENLGITVYYLANPTDLDGLYANLETVGELTGHSNDAKALVTSLQQRVGNVENALANVTTKPLVYYELDGTDPAKPWTPGPDTFLTQLVKLAGGRSVGESLTSDYAQISLEDLLVQNPDIILLGDAAYGTTPEQVAQRAGWSTLAAVKANKIYAFDDDLISRPGPRMVDGLEALAKLLHPDVFGQ